MIETPTPELFCAACTYADGQAHCSRDSTCPANLHRFQIQRGVPLRHAIGLGDPEGLIRGVEARLVGELAQKVHAEGLRFRGWPTIERGWTRWDAAHERPVKCTADESDFCSLLAAVVAGK